MGFFDRLTVHAQGSSLEEVDSEEATDLTVTETQNFLSKFSSLASYLIL